MLKKVNMDLKQIIIIIFVLLLGVGIYFTSNYEYLLFHNIVEIFSILVAISIFFYAWYSRKRIENNYFVFMGISFLFVGIIDFIHTLAYKGMNIFAGYTANLPTQLWISARYLQAISLVIAILFIQRKFSQWVAVGSYAIITAILLTLVFLDIFPACYIEGTGLTAFKKISEYVISGILLGSIIFLVIKREKFDRNILVLLILGTVATIFAELSFTQYVSVFGFFNQLGHLFKLLAFYLFLRAIIIIGLTKPFDLLYKSLKDSEQSLRMLFDSANDAIVVVAANGKIIEINDTATKLLEYPKNEFLQMNFSEIQFEGEKMDLGDSIINNSNKEDVVFEKNLVSKTGKKLHCEVSTANIVYSKEKYAVLMIIRDITQRKRVAQQERYATIGRLAGDMAHHLNNMFGVIMGASELMKASIEDAGLWHYLNVVITQVTRGGTLIKQVLDFSGKSLINFPKPMRIEEFMSSFSDILDMTLPDNIIMKYEIEPLNLVIDAMQFQQLLLNIILNSKDAMDNGGEVLISVKHSSSTDVLDFEDRKIVEDDYIHLIVKDNGCGIEKDYIKKIFEPFFTTKKLGEGSGLGLAQVYGIVRQYNGYLFVESEVNAGTSIHIFLPEYKGEIKEEIEVEVPVIKIKSKILLVEDDEELLKVMKAIIEDQGYEVVTANNGKVAMELFDDTIDLIITDIVMPEIGGNELIEIILETNPNAKFIVMTGYGNVSVPKGIEVLYKPIPRKVLSETLQKVLVAI